jgi:hypothetical protein
LVAYLSFEGEVSLWIVDLQSSHRRGIVGIVLQ